MRLPTTPPTKLLAALLALVVAFPAWADCPLDLGRGTGIVVFSSHYLVAFRPEPLRIEVGQPFSLLMNVWFHSCDCGL